VEQLNPAPLVKQLLLLLLVPLLLLLQLLLLRLHPLDLESWAAVSEAIEALLIVEASEVKTLRLGTRWQYAVDLSVQAQVVAPAHLHLGWMVDFPVHVAGHLPKVPRGRC